MASRFFRAAAEWTLRRRGGGGAHSFGFRERHLGFLFALSVPSGAPSGQLLMDGEFGEGGLPCYTSYIGGTGGTVGGVQWAADSVHIIVIIICL